MKMPFIFKCDQKKMRQVIKDLRKGYTVKQTAEKHGIAPHTLSKYERIYDHFGLEAFAQVSEQGRKKGMTQARNMRARALVGRL